jgi:predicted phage replisome organizer
MRLKDSFFDSEEMKILEGMEDGYLYSNILLKMCLSSLKNEGRLMLNNLIPYNANMIATITGHQIGTVERALKIFQQIGLIEVLDDGAIYMLTIQGMIGEGSTEADKKREHRAKVEAQKAVGQIEDKSRSNVRHSNSKSKSKSNSKSKREETRHKYGAYNNVLLSDTELEKLKTEFPSDYQNRIERLSEYIASTGKSYKSHLATIRSWAHRDGEKQTERQNKYTNFNQRDYDFDELERELLKQ